MFSSECCKFDDDNLAWRIMMVLAIQTTSSGRTSPTTLMTRSMSRRMGSSTNRRTDSWEAVFALPHIVGDFWYG